MTEQQTRPPSPFVMPCLISSDLERSRRFYVDIMGGEVARDDPLIVRFGGGAIVIAEGGGPTDDKPAVTLVPPSHTDKVSAIVNIRVDDIDTTYREWSERGAEFMTPPTDRGPEIRAYLRDPDGHLIELGQGKR